MSVQNTAVGVHRVHLLAANTLRIGGPRDWSYARPHSLLSVLCVLAASACRPPPQVQTRPASCCPSFRSTSTTPQPSPTTTWRPGPRSYAGTRAAGQRRQSSRGRPGDAQECGLSGQARPRVCGIRDADSATLDLTVPGDGSWLPFVVAGGAGPASQRDKDAIIEVLERRPDGIVLARKSLMVTASTPIPPGIPQVEIFFGGTATIDDYLAWAPGKRPGTPRCRVGSCSGRRSPCGTCRRWSAGVWSSVRCRQYQTTSCRRR